MTTLDRTERLRRLPPEKRALLLEALRRGQTPDEIPRLPAGEPAPASFAQQRLWLLDQITPGNPAYNVPFAVRLSGRLDLPALAAALDEVTRRHDVLRAVFSPGPDGPLQVVLPPAGLPLPRVDLDGLRDAVCDAEARRLALELSRQPFDLTRGPLIRAALLRLGPAEHLLVFNLHHTVTDGWSNGILLAEMGELYRGARLPAPKVQYADFAAWQRRRLDGEALAPLLSYWRRQLDGAPASLDLPTDRPRSSHRAPLGGVVPLVLDGEAVAALEALGKTWDASLFMVLLAGFQALLGRWAGAEDVVVGAPVAGRSRSEVEPLIGFFVNTLPLRVDLAGDPAFSRLVERVRRVTLEAHEHAAVPFEKLVEELRLGREAGGNPLFQVALAFQNTPGPALDLPGLTVAPIPLYGGIAKFDLTLSVEPGDAGGLTVWLEHSGELFDATTATRLLEQWARLLSAIAERPETRLSELPLLSAAERHQVAVEWSAGPAAEPEATVHGLFEAWAAASPMAPALLADNLELTYDEVNRRANRLAHHLRSLGIAPDVPVGVALERSPGMVVALLAVLKAGGAYVPLDPGYPDERLARMLEDADPPLVITSGPLAGRFAALADGRRIVDLDGEREAIAAREEDDPGVGVSPEGLAYILFTSGSTGRPKGVAVPHRAVARLVRQSSFARLGPDEVLLQLAPVSFDASTLEIWGALANGARLAMMPAGAPSLADLESALGRFGVTTLWLTAGLFHQMVDERPAALSGVRQLLAGGDVLSPAHVRRLLAAVPGCTLINGYGPTENTTFTCCQPFHHPEEVTAPVPIGRPIGGTRALVLDAAFRPVPLGVAGELCAGGAGLARGYAGQPALTAERFVPDPTGPLGGRLYRTGDRVRFLADGRIEFLGRLDQQVKVRGFRIEPEEIETVLGTHPGVRQAVVVAVPDRHDDKRLAAYVVRSPETEASPGSLQVWLGERLPPYMVPALWAFLPELPLGATGKVDRRALPDPVQSASARRRTPPRTSTEEILAGIWAELLGLPEVGVDEDFFALGGHSLLATRVGARVYEVFGVELPLADLFDHRTVEDLAPRIEALRAGFQEDSPEPPLTPLGRDVPLPLSFAQERLWILDRFEPGTANYNIHGSVRLRGDLDLGALRRALERVVERHEALRTVFEPAEDGAVQRVLPRMEVALELVELNPPPDLPHSLPRPLPGGEAPPPPQDPGLAATGREVVLSPVDLERSGSERTSSRPQGAVVPPPLGGGAVGSGGGQEGGFSGSAVEDWERQVAATSFDLARGPLLRLVLLRLGPDEHVLLLAIHHIVSDGWSMGVLVREITAAYAAFKEGREPELPALPVQYADFAAWQRRRLSGERLERLVAYWRRHLSPETGAPPGLELPADRPRPAIRTFRGGRLTLAVPGEMADRLRSLTRRQGTSLFMTLLAAFQVLLARLSGEEDVVVGTPIAGRSRAEVEGLIGMFLNTLVLRTGLAGDLTFTALLGRMRDEALAAYAHQDLPFEKLLDELRPGRDLSRTPLFQVFFNMLNFPVARLEAPGLTVEVLAPPELPAKFDLTVYAAEEGAGLRFDFVYNADLFSDARMAEVARQYEALLAQVAAQPERAIGSLSLVTPGMAAVLPDPRSPLGDEWYGPVHERFVAEARRAPERLAASDRDESWTYGELEARTARLAAHLVAGRVGRGDVVALYGHRSARLVWAILGVMRAGAAFTVLDPAHPPSRIADCLRLAEPRGWIDLAAAGPVPAAVEGAVAAIPCRVTLPLPAVSPEAAPAIDPPLTADDLAYIAFTSGSTGVPKGILGRHGPLSHFIPWQQQEFDLRASDRYSMLSGLAHDPLQRDIFTPLQTGAAVCVPDPAEIQVPGRLAEWMARERITVAHLTPAMGQLLTELPQGAPGAPAPRLTSLRRAFFVGDILTRRDVARLRELAPEVTCVNFYGSTETQRAVGYREVEDGGARLAAGAGKENLPLGRGMKDVQLLVLGPSGGLAGLGELGEIHVRSPHLARGYIGDPAGTAARFAPDAGSPDPGGRVYRTGDLGRYLPTGDVEFAGRTDFQVKIRGFRIEPGEIEAVLTRHPAVRECIVLARDGAAGEKRLVAYLILQQELGVGDLRAWLKDRLPEAMIPAAFVTLERLPLNPNGKVDRRALPEPSHDASSEPGSFVAPTNETERTIAAVLQDVLGRDRIGIHDNFFELGGNSLLLVRAHARMRELIGGELQVVDLFSHPTVAMLATYVGKGGAATAMSAISAMSAASAARQSDERMNKVEAGQSRLQKLRQRRQQA